MLQHTHLNNSHLNNSQSYPKNNLRGRNQFQGEILAPGGDKVFQGESPWSPAYLQIITALAGLAVCFNTRKLRVRVANVVMINGRSHGKITSHLV